MADKKKYVFKVDLQGARDKHKALKAISSLEGVDSIALDTKDNKLTVIGNVDPVVVVAKLRKCWYTSIISVEPAKEPEKKKEEAKKDEEKKEKGKEEAKQDEEKKEKGKVEEQVAELLKAYQAYNPEVTTSYHYVQSAEENPNACEIM